MSLLDSLIAAKETKDEPLYHAFAGSYAFRMWEAEESRSTRKGRLLARALLAMQCAHTLVHGFAPLTHRRRAMELAPDQECYVIELSRCQRLAANTAEGAHSQALPYALLKCYAQRCPGV